ncbi:Uncharacterized protein C2orf47-like, mitochondrial [Papilio machaon]|uniref:Uncharacterized protein C2orf47-like, mitochondrial n=1 Tax=Papilio machaon TaxID=76193 RepID=A0A0N1PHY3_PAPMA|nr:Uncharacterized protein C2orf47-like, mitochondrial [Papilio machaon]
MIECDVLYGIGVPLEGSFVCTTLELPHSDGGVLTRRHHQTEHWMKYYLRCTPHIINKLECLQKSDFQTLEGLVEKDAIAALKNAVTKLSVSQRQLLSIDKEDIFYAFPYQVGVMFDESDKRWVEITMCYHVLKGLKQMQETGDIPPITLGVQPEFRDKIFILNYRFIREFTKGVEDSWWVNIVNHFQPQSIAKKSF